jgi:hypothetical protein
MLDRFAHYSAGLASPARELLAVVKDDDDDLAGGPCRALLVGTAGTANLIDAAGNEHAGVPLQQGYNAIRIARVKTGGTADDIWALY